MIPKKLWNNKVLYQSEKLVEVYKEKLIELSLYEDARKAEEYGKGAVGGKDEEVTHIHFSERFLASSTRIQYVLLNPNGEFDVMSKDLQVTFSSGNISILDIPSGTGAGILSLLCNISELRINSNLPRLPLYIDIVGGDFSSSALKIYRELLSEIKDYLAQQLIFIEYKAIEWDAGDLLSTNGLLKNWIIDEDAYEEYYILMSAFSGVKEPIYKEFEESFKFIQNYTLHLVTTTMYIEPASNEGKKFLKLINRLMQMIERWFEKDKAVTESRFNWYDAIRENKAKSTVSIELYKRKEL
ncbi:MAG: hypothetical protein GQ531_05960 [Sulfurovum sp.]|nr:hypothetical protein [Sulfurovum sp.]